MSEHFMSLPIGRRISLPGHFDAPVVLEGARPLGQDGAAGYECRVRLPDGTLDETVISPAEAAMLACTQQLPQAAVKPLDAEKLRLLVESSRIRLAYAHDRHFAVSLPGIRTLPYQIEAVYLKMLPQPRLRFLLAGNPGAGRMIMAGPLIKELLVRGDLHRCLIVCPGMLVEQWQDELRDRFLLIFEILTNDKLESARTGNWVLENALAICRLDKFSRDEDIQASLEQRDWDLIVVGEAHKVSASFFGGEVKETKRHKLGRLLSRLTRHLLLTATPHNGKEEDFQLFLRCSMANSSRLDSARGGRKLPS